MPRGKSVEEARRQGGRESKTFDYRWAQVNVDEGNGKTFCDRWRQVSAEKSKGNGADRDDSAPHESRVKSKG